MIFRYAALSNIKDSSNNVVGRFDICLYVSMPYSLATMATNSYSINFAVLCSKCSW